MSAGQKWMEPGTVAWRQSSDGGDDVQCAGRSVQRGTGAQYSFRSRPGEMESNVCSQG